MRTIPISAPDVHELLSHGMGPELHWFPEDVSATRLAAVLVGMANTSGGVVLLGISPRSGQILGLDDPEGALDRVFQASLLADPSLVLPIPYLQAVHQIKLLCITVPAGLPNVYSMEGRYLGREGTQTNPLPARRLRRLLLERGVVQFEAQVPPEVSLDDLDMQKIRAYVEVLNLPRDTSTESEIEVLARRGCLKRIDNRYHPTYAALLLFARHPQQWLPNATLLAARFTGESFNDLFIKQEIGGALPDQLRQAEAFVRDNLRTVVRMAGLSHQETTEYPLEAVRELLVNAVAHRDYNLQGDTIHVNIFLDRIEVHSPGGLPGPVTLNNLLEARFSRNAVIVQALSDLGFVERLGYGLDRVVAAMRQNGLRPPRFEETGGSFRVTLFGGGIAESQSASSQQQATPLLRSYLNQGLNPRQEQALNFLARYPRITSRDYQDLCPDVHTETLRRDMADLVSRGILIKVGDKRGTYYIRK